MMWEIFLVTGRRYHLLFDLTTYCHRCFGCAFLSGDFRLSCGFLCSLKKLIPQSYKKCDEDDTEDHGKVNLKKEQDTVRNKVITDFIDEKRQ